MVSAGGDAVPSRDWVLMRTLDSLIGVDLGATRVRAYRVQVEPQGLRAVSRVQASFKTGFVPLSIERQMAAEPVSPEEAEHGRHRVEVIAHVIRQAAGGGPFRLGLAAPGLKTPCGIGVSRYGPRIPNLLGALEQELGVRPLLLGDDGHLAGVGEEVGAAGRFRGVADAYLVAAGTGLGEALKRGGCLLKEFPRAWQVAPEVEQALRAAAWRHAPRVDELADALAALVSMRGRVQRLVLAQRFVELQELAAVLEQRLGIEVCFSRLPEGPALGAVACMLGETAVENEG